MVRRQVRGGLPTTDPIITKDQLWLVRSGQFGAMSRAFCFTWNNYDESVVEYLRVPGAVKYVVGGYETAPETGTPHIQGFVYFWHKKTLSAAIKYLKGAHVEIARNIEASIEYCKKGGTFFEEGTAPLSSKEKGNKTQELVAARNKVLLECNLNDAVRSGLISANQIPVIHRARAILGALLEPYDHDCVRGQWYVGPPNAGKSHTARERYPGAYLKAMNKWWDGYNGQEAVILDDLDSDCLGHYLKIWTDKYACQGEIKNGHVQLRHKVFVVTSNFAIEELFKEEKMAEAVKRRFHVTHFHKLC